MGKKTTKAQAAAEVRASRAHVVRFTSARHGGITVTFKVPADGPRGQAVFDRHPDKPSKMEGGLFWCPHHFALFMVRFPAGHSSAVMKRMAALDTMEPHASAETTLLPEPESPQ